MKVEFQDFYVQHVTVHNETGSGNIRLVIRTTADMNDLHKTKAEDCPIITDISLDEPLLKILIGALQRMEIAT